MVQLFHNTDITHVSVACYWFEFSDLHWVNTSTLVGNVPTGTSEVMPMLCRRASASRLFLSRSESSVTGAASFFWSAWKQGRLKVSLNWKTYPSSPQITRDVGGSSGHQPPLSCSNYNTHNSHTTGLNVGVSVAVSTWSSEAHSICYHGNTESKMGTAGWQILLPSHYQQIQRITPSACCMWNGGGIWLIPPPRTIWSL